MYIDMTYIILVLPAVIFSIWASSRVNSTYKKYSKINSKRQITGAEAARYVLNSNGVYDVNIEHVSGNLTDHYDPRSKIIRLSDSVYNSTSAAAIGVAAHEAGHALQYAEGYAPIKIRSAIIPVTNITSRLAMPLILIGLIFYGSAATFLAYVGIGCFMFSTLFQLITLPTEFNASRRALNAIEQNGILYDDEIPGAKRVLSAAAMTYVAALAVSVTQLLRLLLIINGRNSRRR